MPTNLNAALRYVAIDKYLRKATVPVNWRMLAEVCKDESRDRVISKRTLMNDIAAMRSGRLGYEAPIAYSKERGYHYTTTNFSIHTVPIKKEIVDTLRDTVHIAKQLMGHDLFSSVGHALALLQDQLNIELDPAASKIIHVEASTNYKAHQWLDTVYQQIKAQQALKIAYKPFTRPLETLIFSPHWLQEYSGRWYAVGYEHAHERVVNLALDRVESIVQSISSYVTAEQQPEQYYKYVYGITKHVAPPQEIVFAVDEKLEHYIATKPIHPTQRSLSTADRTYSITVVWNYEIQSKLLSYGSALLIKAPTDIVNHVSQEISAMHRSYSTHG